MNRKFIPDQFTATEFATVEDKAKFANWFTDFVNSGFPRSKFHKKNYHHLNSMFSHIAHYDINGFYSVKFSNLQKKADFLSHVENFNSYGSPRFTWCDVEEVLSLWVKENDLASQYTKMVNEYTQEKEIEILRSLMAKYPEIRHE
jgi:hypothetical protein